MSQEILNQYVQSMKAGQKYVKAAQGRGENPYPLVLDTLLENVKIVRQEKLGLLDIPTELIVGTKTVGRMNALAGNFMPLLAENTEFASKWMLLCEAHLEEGIRDPVQCYEYLGKFYIEEGNKRVSVLRSFDAPSVPGSVVRLVPEKTDGEPDPSLRLEERFIHHPALAIEQSRTTINEMAEKARTGLDLALDLLFNYNETNRARVEQLEAQVDRYEDVLGSYLVQLTGQELSDLQNQTVTKYLHTLSDLERISDHALNIAENADEIHEKGLRFSDAAHKELDVLIAAVKNVVQLAIDSFLSGDLDQARHVEPLEEVIDNLCDAMKLHHVERLQKGICTIQQGFVFNDFVTNCERVSDHCSNVALAMLELNAGNPGAHELLNRIRERHAGDYDRYLETYTVKYEI